MIPSKLASKMWLLLALRSLRAYVFGQLFCFSESMLRESNIVLESAEPTFGCNADTGSVLGTITRCNLPQFPCFAWDFAAVSSTGP